MPTTSQVKLIDTRKFAKVALDENSKTFVVHIANLEVQTAMLIYPSKALQVQNHPILAALWWYKASTKISAKYFDYADVFSSNLAMELPENIGINKYAIKLIDGK